MPKKIKSQSPVRRTRFQPPRSCSKKPPSFPRFFHLPAELRRKVYSHLLLSSSCIDVWSAKQPEDPLTYCSCNRILHVSILRTCRLIHDEASQYLYSANTFSIMECCDYHGLDDDCLEVNPALAWLDDIGFRNSRHILSLQLRFRIERSFTNYYTEMFDVLAAKTPSLTRIAIAAEKHKICRLINDGEDYDSADDENSPDAMLDEDDINLLSSDDLNPFIYAPPYTYKSYFVTSVPTEDRLELARKLAQFKSLRHVLLFGKHSKKPGLKDFCTIAKCKVSETHETKHPRLTIPWVLDVASEWAPGTHGGATKVHHVRAEPASDGKDRRTIRRAGKDIEHEMYY